MGDRTAPGARAASAATSTALEGSGPVLVSLILVVAVTGLNLSVAKVGLPDIGRVAVADGCVLVPAARPPVDASITTAAQLAPSRRSCPGLMVAA
jgi:hypothetical protein